MIAPSQAPLDRARGRLAKGPMRSLLLLLLASLGCGGPAPVAADSGTPAQAKGPTKVGYDIRRLRPRNEETLAAMFERMRAQTLADDKFAAVLFSADWCEPCRRLDIELGNMHPREAIGHVRIFEIKEEDWEAATRMNEVNALRTKWTPTINAYPVLVLLDEKGERIEEMQDAQDRLEHEGVEPTLPNWFGALKG